MTASQYKNIVHWTLCDSRFSTDTPSLDVARKLFRNMGISFPQGSSTEQIITILKTNTFLGWRQNSREDAQKYADIGIVSIGMNNEKIVVILPDDNTPILTNISDIISVENPNVKHTQKLTDEEKKSMLFFSYRYRFEIEKEKDS